MKNAAQKFLTTAEQQKVTETVQQAELNTSGEIVPMVVYESYGYPKALLAASLFISMPLALLLCYILSSFLWIDPENVYFFFSLQVPLFFLCHVLLKSFPSMTRMFISQEEMQAEVEEEAIKSFFQERLYDTRDNNGVLIFISVFEKKAWILVDHGVEKKVDQGVWEEIMAELTSKIGQGSRCEALCDAIVKVGDILRTHFPYKKDDTDELHNLIIR